MHSKLNLFYFNVYEKESNSLRPDTRVLWSFEELSAWQAGVLAEIRKRQNEN